MLKEDVLKKLTDCGLVAVVRANNAEEAIKISDACLAGGCTGIELTFTVPGADKVIAALAEKYSNGEMMLGAVLFLILKQQEWLSWQVQTLS